MCRWNSKKNLAVDALVDSRSYVSAIAQNDLDTKKQKAPIIILETHFPPNFQIKVINVQLENSLSKATINIEIKDNTLAEHFVVMRKVTKPKKGCFLWGTTVYSLTRHKASFISHAGRWKLKLLQVKQSQNPNLSSLTMPWRYDRGQQKQSQPLSTTRQNERQQGL